MIICRAKSTSGGITRYCQGNIGCNALLAKRATRRHIITPIGKSVWSQPFQIYNVSSTRILSTTPTDPDSPENLIAAANIQSREICAIAMMHSNRPLARSGENKSFEKQTSFHSKASSNSSNNLRRLRRRNDNWSKNQHYRPDSDSEHFTLNSPELPQAAKAAEALTKLTSHPSFKQALEEQREAYMQISKSKNSHQDKALNYTDPNLHHVDVAFSLHNAFVSVISWLCSTLSNIELPQSVDSLNFQTPSHDVIILSYILNLTTKSTDLDLPLHIPLYENIAILIARHYAASDVASLVIDISIQARNALNQSQNQHQADSIINASFFIEPIKELIYRNQISNVLEIVDYMNTIYGIDHFDPSTAMELLEVLHNQVKRSLSQYKDNHESNSEKDCSTNDSKEIFLDDVTSTKLAVILQGSIDKHDITPQKKSEIYDNDLEKIFEEEKDDEAPINMSDRDTIIEEVEKDEIHQDCHNFSNEIAKDMALLNEMINNISVEGGDGKVDQTTKDFATEIIEKVRKNNERSKEAPLLIKDEGNVISSGEGKSLTGKSSSQEVSIAGFKIDPQTGMLIIDCNIFDTDAKEKLLTAPNDTLAIPRYIKKEILYGREGNLELQGNLELPDIITQLEQLNGGKSLEFTPEYEDAIFMAEEERFFRNGDFLDDTDYDDED